MHWSASFIIAVVLSMDITLTSEITEETNKSSQRPSPLSNGDNRGKQQIRKIYSNRCFVCISLTLGCFWYLYCEIIFINVLKFLDGYGNNSESSSICSVDETSIKPERCPSDHECSKLDAICMICNCSSDCQYGKTANASCTVPQSINVRKPFVLWSYNSTYRIKRKIFTR